MSGGAIACTLAVLQFSDGAARAGAADKQTRSAATAADAMAAREKAIDEAQRKAFERLVGRLATEGGAKAVAPPEGRALDELVRNFEVDSEKVSAVRYIATFTYDM